MRIARKEDETLKWINGAGIAEENDDVNMHYKEEKPKEDLFIKEEDEEVNEPTAKFLNGMLSEFHHSKIKTKNVTVLKG